MEITLRLEEERDHRIVENLTREAFWNVHSPGADEHLLIRNLRRAQEFVPDLDFVALCGDVIVGSIVYAEAKITDGETEHTVLTFGPISVLPQYQKKGIGRRLLEHTTQLAREKGYRAIVIYGDPQYYQRFGFRQSKEFGVTNRDGKFPAALQALELYPNALQGITGQFDEGRIYEEIDDNELAEFDQEFPVKERIKMSSQDRFLEMVSTFL
jgi:predicted N-acetyltransferase YhbS